MNNGDITAKPPLFGIPIVSTAFNRSHTTLAYALSYDWRRWHSGVPQASSDSNRVMLHPVQPEDIESRRRDR